MSGTDGLSGARVFVLEDETLVSMMIEDMLDALGCEVVGPYARLPAALEAIGSTGKLDLALIDVNVGGERSTPVAEALSEAGIPFVFTTGYDLEGIPEPWRNRPTLRKPFMQPQMEKAMREALNPPV